MSSLDWRLGLPFAESEKGLAPITVTTIRIRFYLICYPFPSQYQCADWLRKSARELLIYNFWQMFMSCQTISRFTNATTFLAALDIISTLDTVSSVTESKYCNCLIFLTTYLPLLDELFFFLIFLVSYFFPFIFLPYLQGFLIQVSYQPLSSSSSKWSFNFRSWF